MMIFKEFFILSKIMAYLESCYESDLWCLINYCLSCWVEAWIRHPLRTKNNQNPLQLWITGTHGSRTNEQIFPKQTTITVTFMVSIGFDIRLLGVSIYQAQRHSQLDTFVPLGQFQNIVIIPFSISVSLLMNTMQIYQQEMQYWCQCNRAMYIQVHSKIAIGNSLDNNLQFFGKNCCIITYFHETIRL